VDVVKIFHGGEGGDVEQCSNLETNSLVFAFDFILLLIVLHLYTCDIICLAFHYSIHSIFLHFRSILILTRKQLSTSTQYLEESKRRSSRAIHREFSFNSYFEWPLA